MRKFSILLLLAISLCSVFALQTNNEVGKNTQYFSFNSPNVYVRADSNDTFYLLTYTISGGSNNTVNLSLSDCSGIKCGQFNIYTIVQTANDQSSGLKPFTITVGNESTTVYYDFDLPTLSVTGSSIDNASRKLNLNFNYSDNAGIENVTLYKKDGNNLLFQNNLSNSSYVYSLTGKETLVLLFRVRDISGNTFDVEKSWNISDLFEPTILSKKIIINNGVYSIDISVQDDENLGELEFEQNGLKVTQSLTGLSISKTVALPFGAGPVNITVRDKQNNAKKDSVTLNDDALKVDYLSEYTNIDEIRLISADSTKCTLNKFGSDASQRTFSKNGDGHSIGVDPEQEGVEYIVKFTCENSQVMKYFEMPFTYDKTKPTRPQISLTANDDGNIDIKWTESTDEQSDVTYVLYRKSKSLFEGSKRVYTDKEVDYPTEYTYYVEAQDKAGNKVQSESESIVPKKVSVSFDTNLKEVSEQTDRYLRFKIEPEKDSTLKVSVLNSGETIYSETFEGEGKLIDFDIALNDGINEVKVELSDTLGNIRKESYFVTLIPEVTSADVETENVTTEVTAVETPSIFANVTNVTIMGPSEIVSKMQGIEIWLWIVFWIVVAVLFIKFVLFAFKESGVKKGGPISSMMKSKDVELKTDLEKIKKARLKAQEEREMAAAKRKAEEERASRGRSKFEEAKLNDLSQRPRTVHIPFEVREKSKHRAERIRGEVGNRESLEPTPKESRRFSFMSKKEKEIEDTKFASYIGKVRGTESWSSIGQYKTKTTEKEERKAVEEADLRKQHEEMERQAAIEEEKAKRQWEKENKRRAIDSFVQKKQEEKGFFGKLFGKKEDKSKHRRGGSGERL